MQTMKVVELVINKLIVVLIF